MHSNLKENCLVLYCITVSIIEIKLCTLHILFFGLIINHTAFKYIINSTVYGILQTYYKITYWHIVHQHIPIIFRMLSISEFHHVHVKIFGGSVKIKWPEKTVSYPFNPLILTQIWLNNIWISLNKCYFQKFCYQHRHFHHI